MHDRSQQPDMRERRVELVRLVSSPLAFFTLCILVLEGFAAIYAAAVGMERLFIQVLVAIMSTIVLMITVALLNPLALYHPRDWSDRQPPSGISYLAAVLVILIAASSGVFAFQYGHFNTLQSDIRELNDQKQSLDNQVRELEGETNALRDELDASEAAKNRAAQEMKSFSHDLERSTGTLEETQDQLTAIQSKVTQVESSLVETIGRLWQEHVEALTFQVYLEIVRGFGPWYRSREDGVRHALQELIGSNRDSTDRTQLPVEERQRDERGILARDWSSGGLSTDDLSQLLRVVQDVMVIGGHASLEVIDSNIRKTVPTVREQHQLSQSVVNSLRDPRNDFLDTVDRLRKEGILVPTKLTPTR